MTDLKKTCEYCEVLLNLFNVNTPGNKFSIALPRPDKNGSDDSCKNKCTLKAMESQSAYTIYANHRGENLVHKQKTIKFDVVGERLATKYIQISRIECFQMTLRCPKTIKRRPCWCPKQILWELNSFLMQTLSLVVLINLHRFWPRE